MRANPGRASSLSLATIVERLGGRVSGDPGTAVSQVGSLENADAGQIAFFSNPRYKAKLAQTRAGAIVLAPEVEGLTSIPRIVTENPYAYFARLSRLFNPEPASPPGVHPQAVVERGARMAASAHVGAGAVVGTGADIGEGSRIGSGCHVGEDVRIGEGSRL